MAVCPRRGLVIFPVAVHVAALGATTAALGPADGLAGALGLNVALGDGLGPPTAGWSGLVTKKAAPTAITPMTVAAATPLSNAGRRTGVDMVLLSCWRHGERWLDAALKVRMVSRRSPGAARPARRSKAAWISSSVSQSDRFIVVPPRARARASDAH